MELFVSEVLDSPQVCVVARELLVVSGAAAVANALTETQGVVVELADSMDADVEGLEMVREVGDQGWTYLWSGHTVCEARLRIGGEGVGEAVEWLAGEGCPRRRFEVVTPEGRVIRLGWEWMEGEGGDAILVTAEQEMVGDTKFGAVQAAVEQLAGCLRGWGNKIDEGSGGSLVVESASGAETNVYPGDSLLLEAGLLVRGNPDALGAFSVKLVHLGLEAW